MRRSSRRSRTARYVEQKERRFFATDLGMVVTDLLVEHFPKILDLKFTAHMEDELDDIATAKEDMVKVLDEFYYPFQEALKAAETQMERVQIPTSEICHVCGAPMVLKFGRTGQFLGCSKYPECKATRPLGGQPRAEAVESEHTCPKCGKPLLIRENKRGEKFLSCSGYPECKESFNIDAEGNPVPSVVETEHVCEKCGKPMVLRQGRAGPFLGCTGYPKCRNALPVDDQGKPVAAGQGRGQVREVRRADGRPPGPPRAVPRLHRTIPSAAAPRPVPDELKEQLAEQPGARRGVAGRRPEVDRRRGDLRGLRRPHARPPRPPRLLPGLRQVPQVQGHQRARRGHAREDQRGGRSLIGADAASGDQRSATSVRPASRSAGSGGCAGRAEGHGVGGGVGPAVRDRDQDVADPALAGGLLGGAADQDLGPAVLPVADLDVGPGDALAPAGSHRLEDRFLGGPAAGEVLDGVLSRLAVADLALGVDPAQEQLAVLLDHLADARAFDDVGADSQDLHDRSILHRRRRSINTRAGSVASGDRARQTIYASLAINTEAAASGHADIRVEFELIRGYRQHGLSTARSRCSDS